MRHSRSASLLLSILVCIAALRAEGAHLDVLFYDVAGQVTTGATDFGPPFELIPDVRLFVVALDIGDITNAPGFTANPNVSFGDALPADVAVPFDVVPVARLAGRNLSYWDGSGAVAFGATPGGERVEIDQKGCFTCAFVTVDGSEEVVAGFSVGTTTGDGSLHKHHDFRVLPAAGSGELSPPGMYLIALTTQVAPLLPSEPYYLLFTKQMSAASIEAASSWIETQLIPEPTAGGAAFAALLALAGLAASRRITGR